MAYKIYSLILPVSIFFSFANFSLSAQLKTIPVSLRLLSSESQQAIPRTLVHIIQGEDTLAHGYTGEDGLISFDATFDLTSTGGSLPVQEEILQISPNPASGNRISITYHSAKATNDLMSINIYDLAGKAYSRHDYFRPGSYIVQLRTKGGQIDASGSLLIQEPGFYSFILRNSFSDNPSRKSGASEGLPFRIVAEKPEFLPFNDTLWIQLNENEYSVALEKASLPSPAFSYSGTLQAGEPVFFDAGESTGASGEELSFSWNFGDDTYSGQKRTAHIFTQPGTYRTVLTATGNFGAKDTISQSLVIQPDAAASDTALITAFVNDLSGKPLPGAIITTGILGMEYLTNAEGKAEVKTPVGTDVTLSVRKTGYTSQFQLINLKTGTTFGDHYFTLNPREPAVTVENSEFGFDITTAGGVRVEIPLEGLVDKNGNLVKGTIEASLTPVDVSDKQALSAFPGEFAGITPDGEAPMLLTYGVAEYIFEKDGNPLQLQNGKFAEIEIPVFVTTHTDGTPVVPGDTSPLWSLDENTGLWVEEGTGTVVESESSLTGLALRASVSHFSWWNHDVAPEPYWPIPECKIIDKNGLPTLDIPAGGACFLEGEIVGPFGPRNRPSTLGSGRPLPVPPYIDIYIHASGGNGLYSGKVKVNGMAGAYENIIIPMSIVYSGGDGDLIAPDTIFSASIEDEADEDTYTFEVTLGESYYIGVGRAPNSTLSGKVSIFNANGSHLSTGTFANQGFGFNLIAEETGTYTIAVAGTANYPGAYSLILEQVPVVEADSDFETTTFFEGQRKQFNFYAEKGDIIYPYIRPDNGNYFRTSLFDMNGNRLLSRNDRYVNAPGYLEIKVDGVYRLEIIASSRAVTKYSVGLASVSQPSVYAEDEEISVYSDSVNVFGKPYFVKFSGKKGDFINYSMSVADSLSIYYALLGPGDEPFYLRNVLRSDDLVNFGSGASGTPYNDSYLLPEDGEYILRVQPGRTGDPEDFTGRFSATLFRPVIKAMELNTAHEDSVSAFGFKMYSLALEKPTSLVFIHDNYVRGGYLYLRVYDKNRKFIKETRSNLFTGSVSYVELGDVFLDSMVYIEHNPSGNGQGNFAFHVVDNEDPIEIASAIPWSRIDGTISRLGERDYYRFNASQGQVVGATFEVHDTSTLMGNVRIYSERDQWVTGSIVVDNWYSQANSDFSSGGKTNITAVIPETGTYILRVDGAFLRQTDARATGGYSLKFNLLDPASNIVVDDETNDNPSAVTGFIKSAIRAAGKQGTITIAPGQFDEYGTVSVRFDSLTITGADTSLTRISLNANTGMDVYGNYLTIQNLQVKNNSYTGIYLRSGVTGTVAENVRITGSAEAIEGNGNNHNTIIRNSGFAMNGGIIVSIAGDNILIENNRFNVSGGSSGTGLSVRGNHSIVRNNEIGNTLTRTVTMNGILANGDSCLIENNILNNYAFGISLSGSQNNPYSTAVIRGNILGSLTGSNGGNSDGIVVSFVTNALVDGNEIMGHPDISRGIRTREAGGVISNNRIRIHRFDGIYINNLDTTPELLVINNTIVKTGLYTNHANIKLLNTGTLSPVRILNNILVSPVNASASDYGVYSQSGILESDYNLFYGHINRYSANLAAGANDITGDPIFADEALRLGSGSPAIDAGTSAGAPAADFEGTVRPSGSAVDIGADEF